jgi:hypothetical protein
MTTTHRGLEPQTGRRAPARRTMLARTAAGVLAGAGAVAVAGGLRSAPAQAASGITYLAPSGDTSGATDYSQITAALAGGMPLVLLPGTFYVNAPIEYPASCSITGALDTYAGDGGTYIQATVAMDAVFCSAGWLESSNGYSQAPVLIENLTISGNNLATYCLVTQNFRSNFSYLRLTASTSHAFVLAFYGQNGTSGIANTMVENRISNCIADSPGGSGFISTDPASTSAITDGFLVDCVVSSPGSTAISISASAGWLISGNHVYGLPSSGIAAGRADATRIVDNYVETFGYSTTAGYYFGIIATSQEPEGCVIANNTVFLTGAIEAGSHAIGLEAASEGGSAMNFVVTGNLLYCASGVGGTTFGVLIQSQSDSTLGITHTGNGLVGSWGTAYYLNDNGGTITNNGAGW